MFARRKNNKEDLLTPRGQITAWSFSRLQDYRKCPRFAMLKHVNGQKEPGNDAMARGSRIDQAITDYIDGKAKTLTPEAVSFKAEFTELRKRKAVTQEQWAFNKNWEQVDWFSKDAWCRIKTDVYLFSLESNSLLIVDNKTGKLNPVHEEQVKLYAVGGLITFPTVDVVDPRLWYTDQGVEMPDKAVLYKREDLPALKKYWEKETKSMLNDKRFAPKPSNACRWCHFRKENGGPCEF